MKKIQRVKRTLKIGNDGYGGKNITVKAVKGDIQFTRTDPHGWGRISDQLSIRKEDLQELVDFLATQIDC
jgi:hypothetical protein